MAATNKGRAPTADELWCLRDLREAIAQEAAAGRLLKESLERQARRDEIAATRRAWLLLMMQRPNGQKRLTE